VRSRYRDRATFSGHCGQQRASANDGQGTGACCEHLKVVVGNRCRDSNEIGVRSDVLGGMAHKDFDAFGPKSIKYR